MLSAPQSFEVSCAAPPSHVAERDDDRTGSEDLAHYSLRKGDLVLQVFPDPREACATVERTQNGVASPREPLSQLAADRDLGLFSDLVLAIFAHELITGYTWDNVPDREIQAQPYPTPVKTCVFGQRPHGTGSWDQLKSYQVIHREQPQSSTSSVLLDGTALLCAALLPAPRSAMPDATQTRRRSGPAEDTITVPSTVVRKFRTSPENISFLVQTGGRAYDDDGAMRSTVDDEHSSYGYGHGYGLGYGSRQGVNVHHTMIDSAKAWWQQLRRRVAMGLSNDDEHSYSDRL